MRKYIFLAGTLALSVARLRDLCAGANRSVDFHCGLSGDHAFDGGKP